VLDLIELRFKMIGRFVEEQVIVVDKLGNFVQIDGQNNNTKGSSGSGKSTVFNALDYLLGLNKIPATVLQSRKIINPEEDAIWVQGEFLWDGEKMTMTRTKSKFEIELSNNIKKGNSAEEQLVKILGMPSELFRKIIHKRQKEGGFFLNLTPGEMHDFLMDCCNLTPFKKKYTIIEAKLKELDAKKAALENDLKIAQNSLGVTQDAILALGLAPIKDMHEEVIEELKGKCDRSAVRLADVIARCEQMDREYAQNCPDTSNSAHDGSIRENLEKRGKEIEEEIRRHLDEEKARQEKVRKEISEKDLRRVRIVFRVDQGAAAQKLATGLAIEIKSIRAQRCPTCDQDWSTESALAKEKAKLAELAQLKEIIVDAVSAAEEKIAIDHELSALKSGLTPITSPQLPILNEELRNITQQILDDKRVSTHFARKRAWQSTRCVVKPT
jgi:DNA repair exonuclease SbcCD ATPase subunit